MGCLASKPQSPVVLVPPNPRKLLQRRHANEDWYGTVNTFTDPPLQIVYRICTAIVLDDWIPMGNGIQHFWSRSEFAVADIPEPQDPDPDRYALAAAVTFLLVKAFNRNIEMGLPRGAPAIIHKDDWDIYTSQPKKYESVPLWAEKAPALQDPLVIPNRAGDTPQEPYSETADEDLLKKNIVAFKQGVFFI